MDPVHIAELEMRLFLFSIAAILAYKMLTGRISLRGLLLRKGKSGTVSPERVQLLLATVALSVRYVSEIGHATHGVMPDIGPNWLYVFGGSSGIYASVKAVTTLRSNGSKQE